MGALVCLCVCVCVRAFVRAFFSCSCIGVCFVHVLRPDCLMWMLLLGVWSNVLVMFTYVCLKPVICIVTKSGRRKVTDIGAYNFQTLDPLPKWRNHSHVESGKLIYILVLFIVVAICVLLLFDSIFYYYYYHLLYRVRL